MAMMVRNNEELLAIRLRTEMSHEGFRLSAEPFRGETQLAPAVEMPLVDLGYREPGREKGSRMLFPDGGDVPPDLDALFRNTAEQSEGDEPIWLQIEYGADILAAFPWEEALSDRIERVLLRIPNFARNTYKPFGDDHPIVVCAASPRAKGAPDWRDPLWRFLSELSTDRVVVLYLGGDASTNDIENLRSINDLEVVAAPRPTADDGSRRERQISDRHDISNPWLRWILDDQQAHGTGKVHALHFFCSGYAQSSRGALAVPESPSINSDAHWARFIGVPEFAALADRLDAQICGFTALGSPTWTEGLRLFVNELSWARPGPIIGDFTGGSAGLGYHALFSGGEGSLVPGPGPTFSVHPRALSDGEVAIPVTRPAAAMFHQRSDFTTELAGLQAQGGGQSGGALPLELQQTVDRLSSARPRSVLRTARDRGALRAMEFLGKLATPENGK